MMELDKGEARLMRGPQNRHQYNTNISQQLSKQMVTKVNQRCITCMLGYSPDGEHTQTRMTDIHPYSTE
jgi:hypothetical protein